GAVFVSEAMASQMAKKYVGIGPKLAVSPIERLSNRELEVFHRIGQGQETRFIADELHLSLKTIQTHCAHIKEKLGLENATALMHAAVRWVENEKRV
ncbi:MAG: LuxR C-terminal-related transcriptional regulator, partial [Opitutaceae bacterium]